MIGYRRDERGSILPMTVLLVVIIITFTAFAVDLGMQRVTRSDMQALSNVVALDLARDMSGRTAAQIEADPDWALAKNRSVERNKWTVGSAPVVTPILGRLDKTTGIFSPVAASQVPTAVKVIAGSKVDFTFVEGSGSASRSAIATVNPGVCFSVGSFAAALNTNESALNGILGGILGVDDLKLLSSGGIASVQNLSVPLLGIATKLGVGTADELIGIPNLTVAGFLAATASVVNSQGETAGASLLDAIVVKLQALPAKPLNLGKILSLAAGDNSALDLNVNVLDLLTGALFVANGENFISVPGLVLNVPGLTNVSSKIKIIEPPKIACGAGATAKSSQVDVELNAKVGGVVSGLSKASFRLNLSVASATGTLTAVKCGTAAPGGSATIDVTTALVKDLLMHLDLSLLGGLFGSLLSVGADVTSGSVGSGPPKTVSLPPSPQSVSGISSLNLAGASIDVTGLGGLLNLLGDILGNVVKPLLLVLDPILTPLLNTILKLVGVSLGGAEVATVGAVNCNSPKLQG